MNTDFTEKEGKLVTAPTGPGFILIFLLFAMLIGSINYGNNMAYILCFLLTSLTLISFLYTRNNLKGLEIINVLSHPVFAGDTLEFTFEIYNRTRGRRISIYAVTDELKPANGENFTGPFTIGPLSRSTGKTSILASSRGRYFFPKITLITGYPLGLFQAKFHIPVNKVYIVYPKPFGSNPWPEPELREDSEECSEGFYNRGGDDFVGVRPYRTGESQHHVDWKAFARGRPMCVKEFTGGGPTQLWFDYTQLNHLYPEIRISQLTQWVLEADEQGKEFGLRLPGTEIRLDTSPGHTVKCLETLAVYQAES